MYQCIECEIGIIDRVFSYSVQHLGHPLCRDCQDWFKDVLDYTTATDEAIALYFALRRKGVDAEMEKCDGYKTIDISIPNSKINVEVDGLHHNFNPRQAMSDLQRTYASFMKEYLTLRIPNSLVKFHLEPTADLIAGMVEINHGRIRNARKKRNWLDLRLNSHLSSDEP